MSCHNLMKAAHGTKQAAALRNITKKRPKMWNRTRWEGKVETTKTSWVMAGEVGQVEDLDTLAIKSDSESDELSAPDSDEEGAKEKPTTFKKCTTEEHQKVMMMLSNQNVVNKQLQAHEVILD